MFQSLEKKVKIVCQRSIEEVVRPKNPPLIFTCDYQSIRSIILNYLSMSVIVINDETAAHPSLKRKLELCKSYTQTGYCGYGENCFFAHGVEELVQHQPILRKKMCRNFHQHKYCKFGSRCNFVHDPQHGFQPKKPRSMLKMMEQYPQFLTSLSFKKKLLNFL